MHITSFEMEGIGEMKVDVEASEEQKRRKTEVAKSREVLVEDAPHSRLLYSLEDIPPWYTCLALGIQHFLMMVESTVSIPYLLTPVMCMVATDPARGAIASTIIFVSGVVTLLQTTFGVRLPIVQGGTHGFLSPILAILALMPCPPENEILELDLDDRRDLWQSRMQQVQGAICVASLFQVVIGFTGVVGILLRWITPLVIVPTITLIGFSLFQVAANKASSHWGISALTVGLLILFSQYLGNVALPWFSYSRGRGFTRTKVFVFKLFPVILAVALSWGLCWLLTYLEVLPEDSHARTDLRTNMLYEAPWFRLPYPCQWGMPSVSVAGVMGVLAGVVASVVESIGDYYACARLSEAPAPPKHAINRGIWMEGIGCVLAGLFGTGSGTTSYSQNVGAIGVTKWMQKPENSAIIKTSLPILDQVLSVLLRTSMFVGGFLGFFLDNTIPGTEEERGLVKWKAMLEKKQTGNEESVVDTSCYDLPFGMERIRKWGWTRFVPVLPTFAGWKAITRKYSLSPSKCSKI
ncbi:solute carrier family 23 member 2-like isoform X4 [Scylla paramamosain]|uniref:solute carrier family 23 member 2-like isoform X4 n=1 Tax=Scylla paramamosain TaxID=85552 RepID=UPI003082B885